MNKNVTYVVVILIILLGAAFYLSKNSSTVVIETPVAQNATTTEQMATTSTATTSNTNTLTANQPKVVDLRGYAASWPSDIPKYPNEVVKYSGGNNPNSGPVESSVVFTTKDAVKTVVNFYLNGLVANGWKITEDGAGTGNMTTFRASKAKRSVGGYAVRDANGKTTVTIGVNIGL
jgi:type II secretory pathway pseudopilin PulG